MITWILIDQARVQTQNVFSTQDIYTINNKTFTAKILDEIFYAEDYKRFEVGKLDEETFIKNFISQKALDLTTDEYRELIKLGTKPIEGMKELLEKLANKYKLAALINEGVEWAEYKMEISGFRDFFKHVIVSGRIGVAKPDKSFYLKSLGILNTSAEKCIFIDDKIKNCTAAEQVGINALRFQNPKKLVADLTDLGLL